MSIDPGLIGPIASLIGTAVVAGLGFILRTLIKQNQTMTAQSQALAVLVARIDPAINNYALLESQVTALATDVAYLRGAHAATP